jgi:hypothetical protein
MAKGNRYHYIALRTGSPVTIAGKYFAWHILTIVWYDISVYA